MLATPQQIRLVHTLKGRAGLDEATYRGVLAGFAVTSSKALTTEQAAELIDRLKGGGAAPRHPGALPMTGAAARKVQALWIAGWCLGVIHDRTDRAACAFIESQTGLKRAAWLRGPDGNRVIEALKAWLAREAGVAWMLHDGASNPDRVAVVDAQLRRLRALGRTPDVGGVSLAQAGSRELDALIQSLGRTLRRALTARTGGA